MDPRNGHILSLSFFRLGATYDLHTTLYSPFRSDTRNTLLKAVCLAIICEPELVSIFCVPLPGQPRKPGGPTLQICGIMTPLFSSSSSSSSSSAIRPD